MLPMRIGGKKEAESGPALVVAIGPKKPRKLPSRIGGSSSYEEEDDAEDMGEPIDHKQAKKDAATEIVLSLGGSRSAVPAVTEALEAFILACMSEPDEDDTEPLEEEEV